MANKILNHTLKIISWNCQSILNKIPETHNYIHSNNIDIALFTETWLTPAKNIYLPHYTTYRFDRQTGPHGGVAICIKDTIKHELLKSYNTQVIETIGISVTELNQQIHFICAYYPGTSNNTQTLNLFKQDIIKLISNNNSFFIVGDLNAKHRLWNNIRANQAGTILYDIMSHNNFTIHHPQTPTYYPPQARFTFPSTLDIILTNNLHTISHISTSNILTSDHLPIEFSVDLTELNTQKLETTSRYDLADWSKFKFSLNQAINIQQHHDHPYSEIEVDNQLNYFTNALKQAIDIAVPKKVIKKHAVELPRSLKDLISNRNTLRRQWQRSRDPILKHQLNLLNRRIHNESFELRNRIFSKKIEELKIGSRDFWKSTKLLKSKLNAIPPLRDKQTNVILMTDEEKANAIANEFSKSHLISQHLSNALVRNQVRTSIIKLDETSNFNFVIRTSPNEIKSIIKNLKPKKSPGSDGITNRSLKHLSKKCLVFLSHLFNNCFEICYFPQEWKISQIVALPKPNKNHSDPSNYRPISLLSSLSKIYEKIILNRLNIFIEDNEILPDEQFGFRSNHSTTQQLSRVVKHIKSNFNTKKSTGMVVMDIEKAFDSIWHDGLLHKMINLNIPVQIVKIIKSFLSNRSFFVKIKKIVSKSHQIPAGVPQGSSLSPVLYNLFTCDFPTFEDVEIALFADDTAIYSSHTFPNEIINNLESCVATLITYFTRWKIKVNISKTQTIFFTKRRALRYLPQRNINFNNIELNWKTDIKYLGLTLDKSLLFSNHILNSRDKANKYIRILYPLINRKSKLNIKNKLLIVKCIFRPMLLYAGEVWGEAAETHIKKLQIIQNKCLKLIYNLPFYYNTLRLHAIDKIPTIKTTLSEKKTKYISRCNNSLNTLVANLHQNT